MRRIGTRMQCLFNGLHRRVQRNLTSPASMRATAPAAHAFRREQLAPYFSRFTSVIDRFDTSPPVTIRHPRTLSGRFIVTARCPANLCVRLTSEMNEPKARLQHARPSCAPARCCVLARTALARTRPFGACKDAKRRTEPHVSAARRKALIRDRAVAWSAKRFSISTAKVHNGNTRDT
jgi:hypothetical protein